MVQESARPENPQDVLDRILSGLKSQQVEERLAALGDLESLKYSSPVILHQLEQMALGDADRSVREAASAALASPVHRFVQKQVSRLTLRERQVILNELQSWQSADLIQPEQAAVLKQRYNFDLTRAAPTPLGKAVPTPPSSAMPTPPVTAAPPAPRPTLAQTLLSETTIKIALYLGAFMIIAAAAILAALVEIARLPILAAVTLGFGAAAVFTRKRLPQPSFVLFIIFSCLLPFDAAVVRDILAINGIPRDLYWAVFYIILTGIWVISTWFYTSRFFSAAAFVAFDLAVLSFTSAFDLEIDAHLLALSAAGLVGLSAVNILIKRRDRNFAQPLFALTLLNTFITILILGSVCLLRGLNITTDTSRDFLNGYWLVDTLSWIAISAYFFYASTLFTFFLFPWAVTLFLLPIPWTFLRTFIGLPSILSIIAIWVTGALYAIGSEVVHLLKNVKARSYHWPLLILAYLPISVAWIWGAIESVTYGFGVALASTIVFIILTVRKPRVLPWTSALIAGLTTYFTFFQLPFMESLNGLPEYLVMAASLALLIPDLFLQADLGANRTLRWPPRILGVLLSLFALLSIASGGFPSSGHRAIVLAVYALLAIGYSLRYKIGWIAYIFTALLPLAALQTLDQFHSPLWLPVLTALAAVYYFSGSLPKFILSSPFRNSGLVLGSLATLIGLFDAHIQGRGWYSLISAALFAVEQYRYKKSWLEAGIFVFASTASWTIQHQFGVSEFGYYLLGISVLWIVLELIIGRTYPDVRRFKNFAVIGSVSAATVTAGYFLVRGAEDPRAAAISFGIFTVIFLINALLRKSPLLGYSVTASLAMTFFFLLRDLKYAGWLFPMVVIALVYYFAGYLQRRREMRLAGSTTTPPIRTDSWTSTLLISGLGLGTLVSFGAPFRGGLDSVIPVALAATLWTFEAFAQRNVWLGFPSNGLYLMAYFMILSALEVNEPQFYSVGAAGLGLLMHYLLSRSGSRQGAFITGMVSQLALLSTTYIQMLSTQRLIFFAVLFFQGLVVLGYGLVIRSRSLVILPIIFVVLGVITVVFNALWGLYTIILIGCTGVILLLLGVLAVILRERLTKIGERLSDWQA